MRYNGCMSIAHLNTLREQFDTALVAGDVNAALGLARRASALLAMTPDSEIGGSKLEWDREALPRVIRDLQQQVGSQRIQTQGVLGQSPIRYRDAGR